MVAAKRKSKKGLHARNRRGAFYIPKKINILGHWYSVSFVDKDKFVFKNDERLGECHWPSRVILISNEIKSNKEFAWLVFIHEYRHGMQYESGMTQILGSQAMEIDADMFASAIESLKKQRVV